MSPLATAHEINVYWFGDYARERWFTVDPGFDDDIRARFEATLMAAEHGGLDTWVARRDSALALTILLDQFPRNLYRGSPRAFACDARARVIAAHAIDARFDLAVSLERRMFFYLPFEHSEALVDQERAVTLFTPWASAHDAAARADADDQLMYVHRHHHIIERFGRFPHRNAALGRISTPEELAFLAEPLSSF